MSKDRREPTDRDIVEYFKDRLAEPLIFGFVLLIIGVILAMLSVIPANAIRMIAGLSAAIGAIILIYGFNSKLLRGY